MANGAIAIYEKKLYAKQYNINHNNTSIYVEYNATDCYNNITLHMLLDKLEKIGGGGLRGLSSTKSMSSSLLFQFCGIEAPPLTLMLIMLASPKIVMDFRLSVGNYYNVSTSMHIIIYINIYA